MQVKNYYQRQIDAGNLEWQQIAKEVDLKNAARGRPPGSQPHPPALYDLESNSVEEQAADDLRFSIPEPRRREHLPEAYAAEQRVQSLDFLLHDPLLAGPATVHRSIYPSEAFPRVFGLAPAASTGQEASSNSVEVAESEYESSDQDISREMPSPQTPPAKKHE